MTLTRTNLLLAGALLTMALLGCQDQTASAPPPDLPEPVATAEPAQLSMYVPCGMTVPFHEAIALFEAANPGIEIDVTYDNDAVLLGRVVDDGERPDLFVSPGGRELDVLAESDLVDAETTVKLGSFEIVAVVGRDSPLKVEKPDDLNALALATIALPDPDRSSMGWHVRQSLQQLELWNDLQEKIVPAERIIVAYQDVVQEKIDLTFTYRGCPLPIDEEQLAKSPVRIAFSLPEESYNVPMVTVGMLNTTKHAAEAQQLLTYLASEQVTTLMVKEGLPDERGLTGVVAAAGSDPAGELTSDADVYILAFYPDNDAHAEVRGVIRSHEDEHPDRVEVEIHDFRDPENDPVGSQMWKRSGLTCAGIMVNGKNGIARGDREVLFQRKMGAQWTQDDLTAAVEAELNEG
ncbi:MAG TPA: substrate-binding domain-containing protein [Armatimonadota bacterium]|nr:substrate-binding domain-containing protein [Armatimonadota bacterium]